jgi:hypothetical protein
MKWRREKVHKTIANRWREMKERERAHGRESERVIEKGRDRKKEGEGGRARERQRKRE